MRVLPIVQCQEVAGGLILDGLACLVPSKGIPPVHFAHIEYAMQKVFEGMWTEAYSQVYLSSVKSMGYFDTYMNNFEQAEWELA